MQRGEVEPVRVLVVDDSVVQRGVLSALLDADPAIAVVGQAASGADAIHQVALLKPDVVTMDLRMPVMDGLEATRRIMQVTPTPIVMVTASLARDDRDMVFAAFQAGVVSIVAKPLPGTQDGRAAGEVRRAVKSMAQVKVIRRWAPDRLRPPVRRTELSAVRPTSHAKVVAIGASTGGPQALRDILPRLPATFAPPVLVVQHIDRDFVAAMVDWLRPQCALPLRLATTNTALDRPGIYVAPADQHLTVAGHSLALIDAPPIRGHRPSVTALFESVAAHYGGGAVGVLLTGMGDDGAAGLRDLRQAGSVTIAQDEPSSVVFGMPAAAIKMGVVDYVLPPAEIAFLLTTLAGCGPEDER